METFIELEVGLVTIGATPVQGDTFSVVVFRWNSKIPSKLSNLISLSQVSLIFTVFPPYALSWFNYIA